jgi:hypothetical protein
MGNPSPKNMMTKSYIVIFFWLLIVGGAFGKNYSIVKTAQNDLAFQTARAFFDQIVFSRAWNAGHGGVYVPVTEKAQPNPYLDDPLRDLETNKGIKLTKINPAFMTRQIAEIAAKEKGVQFHITSLKPIRPGNKPADWERIWLESFNRGNMEQGGFVQDRSNTSFRYMAPLITERSCLKCHAKQGYEVGDIRGGISVILPFFPKANYFSLVLGYGVAALLGSLIIYIAGHMLDKKEREQQELIRNLKRALLEIKTLQGIVPICSFCKKIRDDKGFWSQVESYVSHHTDAQFSHGVCPDCKEEHYPELFNNKKK